ncbi:SDR family NAD(P)-dependent oxidoreductase [Eoetvoesiella caeni]
MSTNQTVTGPIVIFGGASGIGLATATYAAEIYDEVVIADTSDASRLALVRDRKATCVQCDATDPTSVAELLGSVVQRHGRLAAVVTTVGGARVHDPLLIDLEAWRKETAFNLDSAYVVATTAAALMVEHGGGAIVTTSSTFAYVPKADRIGYGASKAGVIALTKSLALATARNNVRVNCVSPGATDTERLRGMTGTAAEFAAICEASVQGRIATTNEVANAILFLSSDAATAVTGQVLWVNNGNYMP